MNLGIIIGTRRLGANTYKAVDLIKEVIKESFPKINMEVIDPRLELYFDGNEPNSSIEYKQAIIRNNLFIIVSPEYNHSFPGTLKTMLDGAFNEYKGKKVLIAGVSSGPWGGSRMIQSLIPTLRKFGLIIHNPDLQFTFADNIEENRAEHEERLRSILEGFIVK